MEERVVTGSTQLCILEGLIQDTLEEPYRRIVQANFPAPYLRGDGSQFRILRSPYLNLSYSLLGEVVQGDVTFQYPSRLHEADALGGHRMVNEYFLRGLKIVDGFSREYLSQAENDASVVKRERRHHSLEGSLSSVKRDVQDRVGRIVLQTSKDSLVEVHFSFTPSSLQYVVTHGKDYTSQDFGFLF